MNACIARGKGKREEGTEGHAHTRRTSQTAHTKRQATYLLKLAVFIVSQPLLAAAQLLVAVFVVSQLLLAVSAAVRIVVSQVQLAAELLL